MDPADLTLPTITPNLTSKTLPSPLTISSRPGKIPIPRVDLEPIYTQLRAALGDQWADYKTAVNAFVLGQLNQAELSWVLQPLLSPAPSVIVVPDPSKSPVSTLHLHNTLLTSIYANLLRDPPPSDVAPWVAATDKPSASAKNAGPGGANDQAEERLKRETMSLHARDRRRIKSLKETPTPVNDGLQEMLDYRNALAVKPPDLSSQSGGGGGAGGLTRTNLDLEVRRRYAHPLAAETLEFPTLSDVQNRIEPICYEEGLLAGGQNALQGCAELVESATEVFLKEMLGHLCSHSRSNGPGFVHMSKFKRQLHKEEEDAERGVVQRNTAGLLPVEMEVQASREPMNLDDMRLALDLSDPYLRQDPFRSESILGNRYPSLETGVIGVAATANAGNGNHEPPHVNGGMEAAPSDDAMAVDDAELWRGGTFQERDELLGVLDDCLTVG